MKLITPPYYHSFQCLASACPDSCCKEWAVQVDEKSAAYYRTLPGKLGDELRSAMIEEDGDIILALTPDQRCPMWRQDGLCKIQAQLGEEALCQTCRQFPRLRHDYGDFVELGLELSCPEAARLILSAPATPLLTEEVAGGNEPDYDRDAMKILLQTRGEALELLAKPEFTVPEALALLYFLAHNAQTLLDGGDVPPLIPAQILTLAQHHAKPVSWTHILDFFRELEILTPQWRQILDAAHAPADWSDCFRSLTSYFVERYWLQAVSDYDLLCRVKFILISCLLIRHLGDDLLYIAQLYSKEIENSNENVEALLDAAYTHPAFTDDRLLGALLAE